MDVSLNTFSSSVCKAAHRMFSLAKTFLQHEYLVQTVSCNDRTHGHGHTNQIPWVSIYLADQQLLSHVSCGFIWDKDHLTLQRSATTTLSLVCSLHARKVLGPSQMPNSCQLTGCLLAVTNRTYLEMELALYQVVLKESSHTVPEYFCKRQRFGFVDLDLTCLYVL